jgi:hypothetical protein
MKNGMVDDFSDGVTGNLSSARAGTAALDGSPASTLGLKLNL